MSIENYRKKFYKLLESDMGNVKPLICENDIDEDKVDLRGTYLSDDNVNNYKTSNKQNVTPDDKSVSSIKGNQFRNAGAVSNNEYGITFTPSMEGSHVYKVNFPDEFIQKYFSLPASEVYGSLGPYGDEHGRDIPMNAKTSWGDLKSVRDILDNVHIQTEGPPTNRTHFPGGIPSSLRGTGLGYIIYESFIKHLGWGCSTGNASDLAKVTWSKILQDPDFYSFVFSTNITDDTVCAINKKNNKNISPVKIFKMVAGNKINDGRGIGVRFGDDFVKDYPEVKKVMSTDLLKTIVDEVSENVSGKINEIILLIKELMLVFKYPTKINDAETEEKKNELINKVYDMNYRFYNESIKLQNLLDRDIDIPERVFEILKNSFSKFINEFYSGNMGSASDIDNLKTTDDVKWMFLSVIKSSEIVKLLEEVKQLIRSVIVAKENSIKSKSTFNVN